MLKYLILAVGVVAGASSALFIQASTTPPGTVVAVRLLLAALVLLPVMIWDMKRDGRVWTFAKFWLPVVPGGIMMGLHLITWTIGVRQTSIANASLIVNLMPVAMPFVMYFAAKEKITRFEILGSLLALTGVAVLTIGQAEFSSHSFRGDLICSGSMMLAVFYLVSARLFAKGRPLWTYIVPLYFIAGLLALAFSVFEWPRLAPPSTHEVVMLVCLALIPTVIGHSAIQVSMLQMRSQVVSIANLGQFIVAAVMAWVFFHQTPAASYFIASPLIALGALIVVFGSSKRAVQMKER